MANYNRSILVGRVVRDPEIKILESGLKIAKFSIAVDRKGPKETRKTDFFDLTAFGGKDGKDRLAGIIEKIVKKGYLVIVDGELQINEYKDSEGNNRKKINIVIENLQVLNSGLKNKEEIQSEEKKDYKITETEDIDMELPF